MGLDVLVSKLTRWFRGRSNLGPQLPLREPVVVNGHDAAGARRDLLLGLSWHTVLGRDLVRQARRRAWQMRATHWVHAGGRAESVGLLRRRQRADAGRGSLTLGYAAAQVFARLAGSGVHAALMPLPDSSQRYWFCAVREGQVLNQSDLICADQQAAAQVLAQWLDQQQAPVIVWGESRPDPAPASVNHRSLHWTQLTLAAGPAAKVQAVRNYPIAVRDVVVLALGATALLSAGLWWWLQRQPVLPPASTTPLPVVAPDEIWHQAYELWRHDHPLTQHQGMQRLLHDLVQLPASVAGWVLVAAECHRAEAVLWRCEARFQRRHRLARQAEFAAVLTDLGSLQWLSLDEVELHWQQEALIHLIDWQALASQRGQMVADADRLLAWQPLWRRLELSSPQPIHPVLPPTHGTVPRPPGMPGLAKRDLLLYGPLRNASVLPAALADRVAWQTVRVQHDPRVRPGIRQSVLMLTLQGALYESDQSG